MDRSGFDYAEAFSRNLGLLSEAEQERVRWARVGVAGLGGVGGSHALSMARLGAGSFHLADPEVFEVANFNRQVGATMDSVGRSKAEVMATSIRGINPGAEVRTFPHGIQPGNIDAFLDGLDVVMDGLEFFAIETRRMMHAACRDRGVPVIQAGPVGYGAALTVFLPSGPSFDDHFGIDDSMSRVEMLAAHALGHGRGAREDIDPTRVDFEARTAPGLTSACLLCSALAATEALKLIVGRGSAVAAPNGLYFDPFRGRIERLGPVPSLKHSWRGRLARWLLFRRFPNLARLHLRETADQTRAAARALC